MLRGFFMPLPHQTPKHYLCTMDKQQETEVHKQLIDISIKSHIQSLVTVGQIDESDFYLNADGDKMINITDDAGDLIVFNYTQGKLHSYAGRLRD